MNKTLVALKIIPLIVFPVFSDRYFDLTKGNTWFYKATVMVSQHWEGTISIVGDTSFGEGKTYSVLYGKSHPFKNKFLRLDSNRLFGYSIYKNEEELEIDFNKTKIDTPYANDEWQYVGMFRGYRYGDSTNIKSYFYYSTSGFNTTVSFSDKFGLLEFTLQGDLAPEETYIIKGAKLNGREFGDVTSIIKRVKPKKKKQTLKYFKGQIIYSGSKLYDLRGCLIGNKEIEVLNSN